MVCVSCIVIPLVLYIWHKFLQPIFLKIWNPWAKVEDKTGDDQDKEMKLSCPMSSPNIGKGSNEAALTTEGKGKVD